jgi:hypothetical protein
MELEAAQLREAKLFQQLKETQQELAFTQGDLLTAVEELRVAGGARDMYAAESKAIHPATASHIHIHLQEELDEVRESLTLSQSSLAHETSMCALTKSHLARSQSQNQTLSEQLSAARKDAVIAGEVRLLMH